MSEIHSLECPKKDCGKVSPKIYEDEGGEVFYCAVHGEFKICERGGIYWKKIKIVKKIVWQEMHAYELSTTHD